MRSESVMVDGVLEEVPSNLLEKRVSTGLPADEYTLVDGEYKIAHTEEELTAVESLKAVEVERDAALSAEDFTVTVGDNVFQMDPKTRKYLLEVISLYSAVGSAPADFEWRDINNVMHPADLPFLINLALLRSAEEKAIWAKSFADKAAIRSA